MSKLSQDTTTQISIFKETNGVSISVNVYTDNFMSIIYNKVPNIGYIEITHVNTQYKEKCYFDNLDFFLKAPKKTIKNVCIQEIKQKDLYYKGIINDILELIYALVKKNYLTRAIGHNY